MTNELSTSGRVLHSALGYDVTVWVATLGRERQFREEIVNLARLAAGEAVLDIGCGTGTLAIAAKRRLGHTGDVYAIDASPQMIARARSKARKAKAQITFVNALAEALPFEDGLFDVVLCTVVLHHLPAKPRLQCLREIRRVLKPGGRALLVDFEHSGSRDKGLLVHLPRYRARHGYVKNADLVRAAEESGLQIIESGELHFLGMHFVLAGHQ
jgi:ubiquinone/menaquinone biosynthesis C-methylase UbiE